MPRFQRRVMFAALFMLLIIFVALYEYAFVSDRYQSEVLLILNQEQSGITTFNLSFLGLPATGEDKDALSVVEFIMSRDMLHYLDDKLHLRDHYSSSRIDWLTRFSNTATFEDFYNYMTNWLIVTYDPTSKFIHLQLQSFDANYSKAVIDAIIAKSQQFIDTLNAKMTAESTRFFEDKMVESENRLNDAKQALLNFQRANRLLTTQKESSIVMSTISALETTLTTDKSNYDSLATTLTPNAPRLQQMRSDMTALANQISIEKDRLSGASTSSVSKLNAQYSDLQLNLEMVTEIYTSNLSQLEQARIEAARKVKFLLLVASPWAADESLYPARRYIVITVGLLLIIVFIALDQTLSKVRGHTV